MNYYLTETWTVSRGRETYGYNICTIRAYSSVWEKTKGVELANASCKGGGYDMAGTSLADCLAALPDVQQALQRLITKETAETFQDVDGTYRNPNTKYYGSFLKADGTVSLDGGVGTSTVLEIFQAAGVNVTPNYQKKRGGKLDRIGWFVRECNPQES